jgi:hypothetical protein
VQEFPTNPPPSAYSYVDDGTRLAVDLPGDGSIRVRAVSGSVGASVVLSIIGAQRLTTMLGSAITTAIHRGLPGGRTD